MSTQLWPQIREILQECAFSLKAWRVWLYMGLQDVRNQFRRSRVGVAWIVINLALMAGGIGYIYGHLFHQDISQFIPLLILGLTVWIFISTTIVQGCQAFTMSEGYVKQFSFPKQLYLLRFLMATLVNFFFGLFIYFCVALCLKLPFSLGALWAIPGLFLLIFISLAHIVICAYLGARFRDLGPALSGIFQILFYVTPIIFTAQMLHERKLDFIYQYNPLYYLMEAVRYPLLHGAMAPPTVYEFVFLYGVLAWGVAFYLLFKLDRKVVYWL